MIEIIEILTQVGTIHRIVSMVMIQIITRTNLTEIKGKRQIVAIMIEKITKVMTQKIITMVKIEEVKR